MNAHVDQPPIDQLAWRRSSYSSEEGGECIEVAASPGTVHVRDSKDTTAALDCATTHNLPVGRRSEKTQSYANHRGVVMRRIGTALAAMMLAGGGLLAGTVPAVAAPTAVDCAVTWGSLGKTGDSVASRRL